MMEELEKLESEIISESEIESSSLNELKNSIESASHGAFKLYFILRPKREGEFTYEVFRTKTQPNVRRELKKIIKAKIKKITTGSLRLVKYNPAMDFDQDTVEIISGDGVNYLDYFLGEIRSVPSIYEMKTKEVPWAYAITINDKVIFFRKFTKSRMLQKKGWIPLFVERDEFTKIDDPGLSIDEDFDCIYLMESKELYILDRDRFEKIFNYMDVFKLYINRNLNKLNQLVWDTGKLWNLCKTDPRKVRKLYQVLKSSTPSKLNMVKIGSINKDYTLNLPLGKGKIEVNRKNVWIVLRVLNDDYLDSTATKNRYLALLKRKK
jgi:hypothetical protein